MTTIITAARSRKPTREKTFALARHKPLHALAPWSLVHLGDRSEIKAYVMATGKWETVATVDQNAGVDAEATANFIVNVVNNYERMINLIAELAGALEPCLACGSLSWEAEHNAEAALAHMRQEELAV